MKTATTTTYKDFVDWFTARQYQRLTHRLNDACLYFVGVGSDRVDTPRLRDLERWFERIRQDDTVCVIESERVVEGFHVAECSCGWKSSGCTSDDQMKDEVAAHLRSL